MPPLSTSEDAAATGTWVKYNGFVLAGNGGSVEQNAVQEAMVKPDPTGAHQLRMWYTAGWDTTAVCMAVSDDDGFTWTRENGGNPVIGQGAAGVAGNVAHTGMAQDPADPLKLWIFFATTGLTAGPFRYVSSTDGGLTWGNVTNAFTASGWENGVWGNSSCVKKDGVWHLLYEGMHTDGTHWETGYATSSDNMATWVKQNGGNPITTLRVGTGSYGGCDLHLLDDGTWELFYHATPSGFLPSYIYRATSANLIDWEKRPGHEIVPLTLDYEYDQTADPCVLEIGGERVMWYSGVHNPNETSKFGRATYVPAPTSTGGPPTRATSLLEMASLLSTFSTETPTAGTAWTLNGQAAGEYDYTVKTGPLTVSTFTEADWFTSREDVAGQFIVVNGSLTIPAGVTFQPVKRKLFTVLYVAGNLTVDGALTMSARGANHSNDGVGVFLEPIPLRVQAGVTIPALGGAGGARIKSDAQDGLPGTSGVAVGGSGGGGGGGSRFNVTYGGASPNGGGAGAQGTCFSGGPGGGGSRVGPYSYTDAGIYGGAGGSGAGDGASSYRMGGGAGNPPRSDGPWSNGPGGVGTGGTLIVLVTGTLSGTGSLSASGSAGGGSSANNTGTASGGGSGGGVVIVARGAGTGPALSAAGGAGHLNGYNGGNAGAGYTLLTTLA